MRVSLALVVAVASVCALLPVGRGAFSIPVHRALQYKDAAGDHGSQRANMNLDGVLADGNLKRRCLVARWDALTPELFEGYVARGVEGLLIVLPSPDEVVARDAKAQWDAMDAYLVSQPLRMPVFFAHDSIAVRAVEEQLRRVHAGLTSAFDTVELAVNGPVEAPLVAKPVRCSSRRVFFALRHAVQPSEWRIHTATLTHVTTMHGWLQGLSAEAAHLPTILLVAHYDTLASAASLAVGADGNGSGVVAVLELARLLSRLYRQPRNRVAVNFVFLLTGGGRVNYYGAEAWLASVDKDVLDRVDFALCLDSLGSDAGLQLHYSRPPKTAQIQAVYNLFSEHARAANTPLELVRKKVNVSSPLNSFEHEAFARRSVFAMTLSGAASGGSARVSSLDRLAGVNATLLARRVALVGEILAKHAFGFSGRSFDVFEGSLAPDAVSMQQWLNVLARSHRVDAWIDKDKGHAALELMAGRLAAYTEQVVVRHHALPAAVVFRAPLATTLTASVVRGNTFDLIVLAGVLAYLFALHCALEYYSTGSVDLSWASVAGVTRLLNRKRA